MTHTITLTNASTVLLTNVLSSTGWADSVADIINGGSLLVEVFGKFEPKMDGQNLDEAWVKETAIWEITEKQRDACKKAIGKLVEEKKLPVGMPSYHLLKAFGLS